MLFNNHELTNLDTETREIYSYIKELPSQVKASSLDKEIYSLDEYKYAGEYDRWEAVKALFLQGRHSLTYFAQVLDLPKDLQLQIPIPMILMLTKKRWECGYRNYSDGLVKKETMPLKKDSKTESSFPVSKEEKEETLNTIWQMAHLLGYTLSAKKQKKAR